jgi:hypothetical protein
MSDAPSTAAWVAAGVCHEVLLRTLPSLRHDMAGTLSVARMDLALLKRWMAKLTVLMSLDDAAGAAERVQRVDQQFGTLLQGLQALQAWGDEAVASVPCADDLLDHCLAWVRPVLMLAKVATERGDRAGEGLSPVSPSAFKYLCLGAVWYWVDNRPALAGVTLDLQTPGCLRVHAVDHPQGPPVGAGRAPQPVLHPIDAPALAAMARHMGWSLDVAPACLTLRWA